MKITIFYRGIFLVTFE